MAAFVAVVLLVDIGNTHTHAAVADGGGIVADVRFASESLALGQAEKSLARLLRRAKAQRLAGVVFCSVVPRLNTPLKRLLRARWHCAAWQLTARTGTGIGIDYPKPSTIGADRLANAIAAHGHRSVHAGADFEEVLALLVDELQRGDLVLTLGAGNISTFGPRLLETLEGGSS